MIPDLADVANLAPFVTLTFCQVFLCILSVILYTHVLYDWITMTCSNHELSTIKMLYSLKKIILHPFLPKMATSPQWLLSSVPMVAIVKRFSCILYIFLLKLERFSYDLEMKAREQNRNNKRTEIERFDWFIEQTDKRAWVFIG